MAAVDPLVGVWAPEIGLAACLGLIVYFVLVIGARVRARDRGRNLFVNATGMLVLIDRLAQRRHELHVLPVVVPDRARQFIAGSTSS